MQLKDNIYNAFSLDKFYKKVQNMIRTISTELYIQPSASLSKLNVNFIIPSLAPYMTVKSK